MKEKITLFCARVSMTPLFIYSGIGKVTHFSENTSMTPFGLSVMGELMIIVAIVIELGGSLSLLTGYKSKLASEVMLVYVLLASLIFHQFWNFSGEQQIEQVINFTKNISICSGLLCLSLYQRWNEPNR